MKAVSQWSNISMWLKRWMSRSLVTWPPPHATSRALWNFIEGSASKTYPSCSMSGSFISFIIYFSIGVADILGYFSLGSVYFPSATGFGSAWILLNGNCDCFGKGVLIGSDGVSFMVLSSISALDIFYAYSFSIACYLNSYIFLRLAFSINKS